MTATVAARTIGQGEAKRVGQDETGDSAEARHFAVKEGDIVTARIFRFDPARDSAPHFDEFKLPALKWMRVLDVLNYINEDMEEDLAHRWYCGVKKCGTCAVRMNGREVLSCWEPAEPLMVIEPLRHAKILRDLAIDRTEYEKQVVRMHPWLERSEPYPGFPERISHREMTPAVNALNCISCMICYSVCPVLDLGEETNFVGPAPLVQLAQQALDPRDGYDRGRIAVEEGSIFDCVSCYKCQQACPVGVPIVDGVIEPLKARAYRSMPGSAKHQHVFMDIVRSRGRIDPGGLVLQTQGLAAFRHPLRVLALYLRGKIDPLKTFFGKPAPGTGDVRKLYEKTKGWTP